MNFFSSTLFDECLNDYKEEGRWDCCVQGAIIYIKTHANALTVMLQIWTFHFYMFIKDQIRRKRLPPPSPPPSLRSSDEKFNLVYAFSKCNLMSVIGLGSLIYINFVISIENCVRYLYHAERYRGINVWCAEQFVWYTSQALKSAHMQFEYRFINEI